MVPNSYIVMGIQNWTFHRPNVSQILRHFEVSCLGSSLKFYKFPDYDLSDSRCIAFCTATKDFVSGNKFAVGGLSLSLIGSRCLEALTAQLSHSLPVQRLHARMQHQEIKSQCYLQCIQFLGNAKCMKIRAAAHH